MTYKIYVNVNGWKDVATFGNLDYLIMSLDHLIQSHNQILVKKTTDRDEIIFNSNIDDYNEFRNECIKNMKVTELKRSIIRIKEKKK